MSASVDSTVLTKSNFSDFGKIEAKSRTNEEYPKEKRKYFKRYEGGESYMDVAARVYPFIEMLKQRNEDALVVAHKPNLYCSHTRRIASSDMSIVKQPMEKLCLDVNKKSSCG